MKLNAYQKTAIATVLATLFLIFVGGLVRAAGAGLGCPDWPKCFGMWIPPTSVDGLPAGFDESQFNVWKTWIEYVNRLVGVVIGLLIIATFVLSFKYRKKEPSVFYSSMAAFVLVLFQGWLGGQVVESGLSEWLITLHMILAMIIVNVLLFASFKATRGYVRIQIDGELRRKLYLTTGVLLLLTMIQLFLGTQVREGIDLIKEAVVVPPRALWLEQVGEIFPIHRSFSWLLIIVTGWLTYLLVQHEVEGTLKLVGYSVVGLVAAQALFGVGLNFLDMPRVLQVLHLLGFALMVCSQFLMMLMLGVRSDEVVEAG